MDRCSSSPFVGLDASVKKKRSQTSRRPSPKTLWGPVSDGDGDGKAKMYNLNQCISRDSMVGMAVRFTRTKNEDGRLSVVHSNGNGGADPGQCGPSIKLTSAAADGAGNEKRLRKVKLKFGGVTHTIQTKASSNGASASGSSTKASRSSDTARVRVRSVQVRQTYPLLQYKYLSLSQIICWVTSENLLFNF
ncbi:hypothetical protein LIER_43010 [Lithospermum erythrorhizon]|uniref:Uncharacterized protein n=1 Tax=Lithospermum erythrorhizon TaxID=34254 RepID=A0AAV3PEV1_LITER